MESAKFTVYGEPVAKARPRVVNGHAYTPSKTKCHEAKIALVYKTTYHGEKFDVGVPLRLEADFYRMIPKSARKKDREAMIAGTIRPTVKADVDNYAKTVMDALLKVAYEDDNQVVELVCRKFYAEQPRTEIILSKAGDLDGKTMLAVR